MTHMHEYYNIHRCELQTWRETVSEDGMRAQDNYVHLAWIIMCERLLSTCHMCVRTLNTG